MSSESPRQRDRELPLFDLPLRGETEEEPVEGPAPSPPETTGSSKPVENLVLFEDTDEENEEPLPAEEGETPGTAGPTDRLVSGLADLAIQVLAVGAGMLGALWIGVPLRLSSWPAFLGLGLSFSFLYWVVPLAFWGRTPGMAWLGHVARAPDDQPLTFGQAGWRWLGALFTLALAGAPQLLLFGGRNLGDLLSSSRVVVDYHSQR